MLPTGNKWTLNDDDNDTAKSAHGLSAHLSHWLNIIGKKKRIVMRLSDCRGKGSWSCLSQSDSLGTNTSEATKHRKT